MSLEIIGGRDTLTRQQRWSHLLTVILAGIMLFYGWNLRSGWLNATTNYTNVQAGIVAEYPQNWLLDEDGNYVFRVRDMVQLGFKTTIQVAVSPVNENMTERNVLDTLNITRPNLLATYNVLSIETITLPDETPATMMNYTYVDIEPNPFLESVPIVVTGRDILAIKGGQAIIITFRSDALQFDEQLQIFEVFLDNLEF